MPMLHEQLKSVPFHQKRLGETVEDLARHLARSVFHGDDVLEEHHDSSPADRASVFALAHDPERRSRRREEGVPMTCPSESLMYLTDPDR